MHLFWIQGPRRQARLRLEGSFFVIGRAEPFPVFQDDVTISREHAVVVATPTGVSLKDLGSRNGVAVNGRRLERYEEVPLAPGDEVLVGRTTVRWLREGEREPTVAGSAGEAAAPQQVTVDREGRSDTRLNLVVPAPPEGEPEPDGSGDELTRTEDALEEEREPGAEETADLEPLEPGEVEEAPGGEVTEELDLPAALPPPPEPSADPGLPPPEERRPLLE